MPIEIFSRIKDGSLSRVCHDENYCNIQLKYKKKEFKFNVNRLWNNNEGNDEIFNEIAHKSNGYKRVFWLAFGYTGSGKTYTIYALLRSLLEQIKTNSSINQVSVSAYQIYNDKIYDMLDKNKPITVWRTKDLVLKGLKKKKVTDIERLFAVFGKNRKLASTYMNAVSSRSHGIINVFVGDMQYTLVDLAGQESGTTSCDNTRLVKTQGTSINLNMLALKECIRAYYLKEKHIPFRRSLLTLALKPLFVSKCYVAFISTISLNHNIFYQIDSLRYAMALYDDTVDDKSRKYFELCNEYSNYIANMEKINTEEKKIWEQMREGNFEDCYKIKKNLIKKCDAMTEFSAKYKKYQIELPDINLNRKK